jgi:hypothetical protein
MIDIAALDRQIRKVCPIDGVRIWDENDRGQWFIDYAPEATEAQKTAAQAAIAAFDPNGSVVPESISPLQARKALRAAGLLDQVNAAVQAATPDVQDAWEFASEIQRDNPLIAQVAAGLGLTGGQVDQLFIQAAAL